MKQQERTLVMLLSSALAFGVTWALARGFLYVYPIQLGLRPGLKAWVPIDALYGFLGAWLAFLVSGFALWREIPKEKRRQSAGLRAALILGAALVSSLPGSVPDLCFHFGVLKPFHPFLETVNTLSGLLMFATAIAWCAFWALEAAPRRKEPAA